MNNKTIQKIKTKRQKQNIKKSKDQKSKFKLKDIQKLI